MSRRAILSCSLLAGLAALLAGSPVCAAARLDSWMDAEGKKFRGEPIEVLGPLAVFRTGPTTGRRLPLHLLSAEDCVRFHQQIKDRPGRADDWAQAKGAATAELIGHVSRLSGETLAPAELAGRPEPQFLILLLASHGQGDSWQMMSHATAPYQKLQRDHPGLVEAVYLGVGHTAQEHERMAAQMKMQWLIADFGAQRGMRTLWRFAPADGGFGMVVVNRHGVPLLSSMSGAREAVGSVMQGLEGLIELMRPGEPRAAKDVQHYWRAVQPVVHREGQCGPLLALDPLKVDLLRSEGVTHFAADLQIDADGKVVSVRLQPGGDLPPEFADPVADVLREALFIPAVDHGEFVARAYTYQFRASN